jgi:hypothetical protein
LTGWKLRVLGDQNDQGKWVGDANLAEVVWRHPGDFDLALLRMTNVAKEPISNVVFRSYELAAELEQAVAVGFPKARWDSSDNSAKDYSVHGKLRVAGLHGPFTWRVAAADKPDRKTGWVGMSGAAVTSVDGRNRVNLLGVVQEVPSNFSHGQLQIARLAWAFTDPSFAKCISAALGTPAKLVNWRRRSDVRKQINDSPPRFLLMGTKKREIDGALWLSAKFQTRIASAAFSVTSVSINSVQYPFKQYYKDDDGFYHEGKIVDLPTEYVTLEILPNWEEDEPMWLKFKDNGGRRYGPFLLTRPKKSAPSLIE